MPESYTEDDFIVKAHDTFIDQEQKIETVSTTNSDGRSTKSRLTPAEKFPNIDEKKVLRKLDSRILPLVSLLYLLAYLDRGNVGNAKIEGMAEDLHLYGNQYNVCLTIFFITYSICEVPSNVLLKMTKPSRYLPSIMVAWGITMTLMGVVHNYMGLFWARFCLGIAEAGLFPGIAYYLTTYYCRHEFQYRVSLFYAAASLAGAFSGILAFGISKMDGVGGYAGWRWIFILEGLLTVVVAIFAFFFINDYPQDAKFLTEEERQFVIYRLEHDSNSDSLEELTDHESSFFEAEVKEKGMKYFLQAIKDWQIYIQVLIYYGVVAPTYGINFFLPTIIVNLGYTSAKSQLMSVPPYIFASIFSVCLAVLADRAGKRSPFIVICFLIMAIGYSITLSCDPNTKPGAIYTATFFIVTGAYAGFPGVISWLGNNLAGDYKRAIGMALQIGLGNFGGTFGSNIYRSQDGPRFILGHAIAFGFVALGLAATAVTVLLYLHINRKREKEILEGKYKAYTSKQLAEMGDKNPYFKYRI